MYLCNHEFTVVVAIVKIDITVCYSADYRCKDRYFKFQESRDLFAGRSRLYVKTLCVRCKTVLNDKHLNQFTNLEHNI